MIQRAIASFLLALAWATSAAAQTYTIYDSFEGPNGTALTAHSPETNFLGRPWTIATGTSPTLLNGELAYNGASLALIDAGTSEPIVAGVRWTPGTSPGLDAQFVFRAVDAQNFFLFEMFQNRLILYRVVDGVWTQLWLNFIDAGEPRSGTHWLSVETSGTSITVSWDSGVHQFQTTDMTHINGRLYGLRFTSYDPTSTYDYFKVYGTPPPTAVSTAISPANTSIVFEGCCTTLTATGYDASGNPLSNLGFNWTSSNPAVVKVTPTSMNTADVTGTGTGTATITATPVTGPSSTATVTVTAGSTIAYDSFTGASGTALTAHTPEVNELNLPWTVSGAVPTLSNQQLLAPAASIALLEGGTPNLAVAVNWTAGVSANLSNGLVFRATDAQNYFSFDVFADRLYFWRVVSGQQTLIQTIWLGGEPRTGTHNLQAVLNGSSITLYWDSGVYIYNWTDTFTSTRPSTA